MNAIVSVDENWGIGNNGNLLIKLPQDLLYFKTKTTNTHIILGRKTLETFPHQEPLPNRTNIILTRDLEYKKDNCIICHSLNEVFNQIKDISEDEVYVVGGSSVYNQLFPFCEKFYITHLMKKFENVDAYFPNISEMDDIRLCWKSGIITEKGIDYYFAKYERK